MDRAQRRERPAAYRPGRGGAGGGVIALAACLLLAVLPAACDRQKQGEEAVAWVNGEPILFSAFWDEIKARYNEVAEASSPQEDVLFVLKKKVLRDLIRERLLLQEAARRGITVSEETVRARVEEVKAGYTHTALRRNLVRHGMDYDAWVRSLRENLVVEALFASVVQGAGEVTEEEIHRYYQAHLDEFLLPETVEIGQIVVKSRSTAQRLLRLLRRGESFEALAAKHSIGPEREQGGRLGIFKRGELPEPLEEAAFSTPTGKVTSLVETPHGFHVLKVLGRRPARMQPEEEVRDAIARKLAREKKEAFFDAWVDRLVRSSDIRVHGSLVKLLAGQEPVDPLLLPEDAKQETTRPPE